MTDAIQTFLLRFALIGLPVSLAALAALRLWRIASVEVRRRGIAKTLLFVALSAPVTFWAGGKANVNRTGEDAESAREGSAIKQSNNQTIRRSSNRPSSLHRYFAPTNFAAGADIFTRPTNAVTPSVWTRYSVSDDFRVAAPGWVAGICGVVTTQPWGIDTPETIEDGHTTLAPLYATNSFLLGTSDFWAVTNESSKTFVWKDLAFNRDPTNLVSFAATIYEWGDIEFAYANVPDGGFSSFVKIGSETQDMTPLVAEGQTVKLEKNLEQDAEWWLENYPEICHLDASGELVFEYDTNEWCFVEFVFRSDAYDRALHEYWEKFRALSNDVVTIEKYTIFVETNRDPSVDFKYWPRPDLWDNFMHMQLDKYGESADMAGTVIDKLPEGLSSEDVEIFSETNGTVTNIIHWIINDNSRVAAKIGSAPDYGDFGLDEYGYPLSVRNYRSNRPKIYLRFRYTVKADTRVRFLENDNHIYGTWVSKKDGASSYLFPCRSGFVYEVNVDSSFDTVDFPGDEGDEDKIVWKFSDRKRRVNFHRKLSLAVEGATFTNASFATARAVMTPPVENGGYSWGSSDNVSVWPIANGKRADVFLENGNEGYVTCVWDNGANDKWNLCATGTVSIAANHDYTNLTQFAEFKAVPRVLVYEDAHLGTDGIRVPATSNLASTLSCDYNGNRAGSLELSKVSGSDVQVSENGAAVSLPYSWDVSGGGNDAVRSFTVGGLSSGDAATFRLRFTSDAAPDGIDYYATIRAVGLEVVAQRTWPEERHRRVFGPNEGALFSIEGASDEVVWHTPSGVTNGSLARAMMPDTPMDFTATFVIDGCSYSFPISVIGPSACVGTNAVAMTDADWLGVTTNALAVGEVGAGLRIDLKLMPDYVSFEGLRTMEDFAPASDRQGYFTHVNMSAVNHDAQSGAGRINVVQEGNLAGIDCAGTAYRADELPRPWSNGSYVFNIPYYWWVDGSSQTNQFATNVQTFRLFANGDAEVSKFGWTAHRGTNGVQTVTREAQP